MVEGRSVFVFIITELYRGKERGGFLISFCIFVLIIVLYRGKERGGGQDAVTSAPNPQWHTPTH